MNARLTRERRRRSRATKGGALILAVGYLTVITLFATAFLTLLQRTMSSMKEGQRRQVVVNVAEGGLDKAVATLRAQPDTYRGEQDVPLGEGLFSVRVEAVEAPRTYHIVSEARLASVAARGAHARVEAQLVLTPQGTVEQLRWTEVKSW